MSESWIITIIKTSVLDELRKDQLLDTRVDGYIRTRHNGDIVHAYNEFIGYITEEALEILASESIDISDDVLRCIADALTGVKTIQQLIDDIINSSIKRLIDVI